MGRGRGDGGVDGEYSREIFIDSGLALASGPDIDMRQARPGSMRINDDFHVPSIQLPSHIMIR